MSIDLKPLKFLDNKMIKVLVDIMGLDGHIIVSSFVFIELLNKFDEIFKEDDFTIDRLKALLIQTPSWLIVEDLNENVVQSSINIPSFVNESNISIDDTIHLATAVSRGDKMYFLTTDAKLNKLTIPNLLFLGNNG